MFIGGLRVSLYLVVDLYGYLIRRNRKVVIDQSIEDCKKEGLKCTYINIDERKRLRLPSNLGLTCLKPLLLFCLKTDEHCGLKFSGRYLLLQGSQASTTLSLSIDIRAQDKSNQVEKRNLNGQRNVEVELVYPMLAEEDTSVQRASRHQYGSCMEIPM
jgi:hypothetical protein